MKFLGFLLTSCAFIMATHAHAEPSNYTPPPMFGAPVAAPITAPISAPVATPIVTPQPISQPSYQSPQVQQPVTVPRPQPAASPTTKLDFSKREQARIEKESQTEIETIDGVMPPATTTPLPILQTPNSEQQKQAALREQRALEAEQKRIAAAELQMKKDMEAAEREAKKLYGGKIPSVSAEALLDFPVTPQTSAPALQNDPILKSSTAIGQLPKPKAGEMIDDTGVPANKVKRPIVDKVLDIEKAKPAAPPKKPKIKEENLAKEIITIDRDGGKIVETIETDKPKFDTKPKGITSKGITAQTTKMPVVKTKAVEEIPLTSSANSSGKKTTLNFAGSVTELTPAQKSNIDKNIVEILKTKPTARAQILSYATPTNSTGSLSARRVSLTRGLAIRTYIMSHSIAPDRIDVRALGDETPDKKTDKKAADFTNIMIME